MIADASPRIVGPAPPTSVHPFCVQSAQWPCPSYGQLGAHSLELPALVKQRPVVASQAKGVQSADAPRPFREVVASLQ